MTQKADMKSSETMYLSKNVQLYELGLRRPATADFLSALHK